MLIDQNIDSQKYVDIVLISDLVSYANNKNHKYGWFFQQDGAPSHQSKETYESLSTKLNILPGWTPNSPDLNPIELLWGIIKKILKKKEISSIQEFKNTIVEIWDAIPMDTINRIVSSFPERVRMCLEKGGESIQCFIRNNMHCIPEFYCCKEEDSPVLWTNEDDELLKNKVNELGSHWKKLVYFFPNRTSNEIKLRYAKLNLEIRAKKMIIEVPSINELLQHVGPKNGAHSKLNFFFISE